VGETVIDGEGLPLLLVIDETGAVSVTRPLQSAVQPHAWGSVSLVGLNAGDGASTIAYGAGDVLVTGYAGDDLAVARIKPDGVVQTTLVGAPLGSGEATGVRPALARDGSALYVSYLDAEGAPQLLAVDPATGTVTARAVIPSSGPRRSIPVDIAVSASGDRIFLMTEVESTRQDGAISATLQRLSADLQWLGEVPLVNGRSPTLAAQLVAGREGTAYVTLVVGEVGTPKAEVRLVAVPPGASSATRVASFPQLDDVRALAIDSGEDWAYLGGLANASDPLVLTVTPLDLHNGVPRLPVAVCPRGELYDIVLPDGAPHVWVTGRCMDTTATAELWTLR
jgi:hypothetical protein